MGIKQDRFILVIGCTDPNARLPDDSHFKKDEILPGVIAMAWGGPLTNSEIQELREKYRRDEQCGADSSKPESQFNCPITRSNREHRNENMPR